MKIFYWLKALRQNPRPLLYALACAQFVCCFPHLFVSQSKTNNECLPSASITVQEQKNQNYSHYKEFIQQINSLKRGVFLGAGQFGYSGPGKEKVRLPSTVVTSRVNPLTPVETQTTFSSAREMVFTQATQFEKSALYKIFFQSTDFIVQSALRYYVEDLHHKSSVCFQQLTEIKIFCFSKSSHVVLAPRMVRLEVDLLNAAHRLGSISKLFDSGNVYSQPVEWVKKQNLEIKELYTIFENSIKELYTLRFNVSVGDFKKKVRGRFVLFRSKM